MRKILLLIVLCLFSACKCPNPKVCEEDRRDRQAQAKREKDAGTNDDDFIGEMLLVNMSFQ